MAKTLLEEIWDAHVVYSEASRPALLYIDCHLAGLQLKPNPARKP